MEREFNETCEVCEPCDPCATIEQEEMQKPKIGSLLPVFELESVEGKHVSPWEFKEKNNLLLYFFSVKRSDDLETLSVIRQHLQEFTDSNTEVLALASGSVDEVKQCIASLNMPFYILIDKDGEVGKRYHVDQATIFVTDKFGEIECIQSISSNDADEVLGDALSKIELIELECPECGVSSWTQVPR